MSRYRTAAAVVALALITFFQFPGHTWLQQDSQIYVPILERLRDPSVLRNDIVAQRPHVAYTLYDEAARALRAASGTGFREVLQFEQLITRALGIWGLYLMATAMGLTGGTALCVAAICSLGVTIVGPSVLTLEYEPTPRAFAVPLLMLGMGLVAHRRYTAAAVAAAVAFLFHAPTAIPFWAVFGLIAVMRRRWRALIPLGSALVFLLLFARLQGDGAQPFFARLTPAEEHLQRLRASYVWVSTWLFPQILHHVLLFGVAVAAFVRVRHKVPLELRISLLGLAAAGLLSMPASWLLLERAGWSLVPQFQPMRALLFIALAAAFLTAAAGLLAASQKRWFEASLWLAVPYLLPLAPVLTEYFPWRRIALAAGLALATALARRFAPAVAAAAFFAIPMLGGVINYPELHTPELAELSAWARTSTPRDAVFVFPDAGRGLDPGIFRSEALRAVYVDWKGGGQVNYLKGFGEVWGFRWQQTNAQRFRPSDMGQYGGLGIQYVVLRAQSRLPQPPLYANAGYVVYAVR